MTTGLQLVSDAMFAAGALGADEPITAEEYQLVLRRLNRLMDSWSNFRSLCYEVQTDSFTMTAGVAAYSSSLLTVMGRPVDVESMSVRLDNIDWPVDVISRQTWDAISYKLTSAIPQFCFIDGAYPDATLNFYPVPYAAFTCFVSARRSLPATITLATNVALPQGYERFVVDSLGIDICPSFGREPSRTLLAGASEAREALARTNLVVPELETALDRRSDPRDGLIYRGF